MLFAPNNTFQKGIYPHQMIQSLSYMGTVYLPPPSWPSGLPLPLPYDNRIQAAGCQVMPQRSWTMPDLVTKELCRAPVPVCRSHHVHISLQDQIFQCNSTLIILPAFQFCCICGWSVPASSLGGVFLCTHQASVFQGHFTHRKWCFCCFSQGTFTKKKASLHYIQTTVQIYGHGNVFWHCCFWVRLCYQSVEGGIQCLLSYLIVSSLLHISMLWLQFSSYLWMLSTDKW